MGNSGGKRQEPRGKKAKRHAFVTHGGTWLWSCTVCNVPTYSVYSELAGTTTERGDSEDRGEERSG